MSELLPCPFCGSRGKLRDSQFPVIVECENCGATGPKYKYPITGPDLRANAAWNRRATDPALERLKEAALAFKKESLSLRTERDLRIAAVDYAESRKAKP